MAYQCHPIQTSKNSFISDLFQIIYIRSDGYEFELAEMMFSKIVGSQIGYDPTGK